VLTTSKPIYAKKIKPAPRKIPLHPNSPKCPVLGGMNGFQFSGCTYCSPKRMNRSTTASFNTTIRLLTLADSLIPMTRMVDASNTMIMAGRLNNDPVRFQPGWVHATTALATSAEVHQRSGAEVTTVGRWSPK
jgi:hypothetical protein